jgi:hypothetical protein
MTSSEELRQLFDADEWRLISSAPALAGAYTALASDRTITDKEWQALHDALDPLKATADDPLFSMALADTASVVSQALAAKKLPSLALGEIDMTDVDAVRRAALGHFGRVNTALRDAPMEVQRRFKDSILLVAQKVAEAQAEGGFLGIGARDISAGEVQALKDIAGNLGYDTGADSDWSRSVIIPAGGVYGTGRLAQ